MIAETASVEDPSNPQAKPQWITNAFLNTIPQDFPRVKAALYFDSTGNGFTYQMDTSPATLAAVRQVFDNPMYQAPAPTATLSF